MVDIVDVPVTTIDDCLGMLFDPGDGSVWRLDLIDKESGHAVISPRESDFCGYRARIIPIDSIRLPKTVRQFQVLITP